MTVSLSDENDTQVNRHIGFDPAHTTPWFALGTDITAYQQGNDQTSWLKRMALDTTYDDTAAFEPIPSVQEQGYYGARKAEKRTSTAIPVVFLEPLRMRCKTEGEPFNSILVYRSKMGRRTPEISHSQHEVTTDAFKEMVRLIRNLTVSQVSRKEKWEARLDEMHAFESNWDSYDAEPPSAQSIEKARAFMEFLRTIAKEPDSLNPAAVGGVGFTFRQGRRSVYIEFRNTGNSHAAFMGAGRPRIEKVLQTSAGYHAAIHQVEIHLNEQDATAAGSDEANRSRRN